MTMDPIVTITLEAAPNVETGRRPNVQTQFCYSQRHTPHAQAAIERLKRQLDAVTPSPPKHVVCTDGTLRVRKGW